MSYLANKVTAFGICRPPLGKVRRYFVMRKNFDLCAVRYRDGRESRNFGGNVRNTSDPLNLKNHVCVAGWWVQFTSVTALAFASYDISCPALEICSWGPAYFYKSLGKNWIRSFADCTENLISPPKKGGIKLTKKTWNPSLFQIIY